MGGELVARDYVCLVELVVCYPYFRRSSISDPCFALDAFSDHYTRTHK